MVEWNQLGKTLELAVDSESMLVTETFAFVHWRNKTAELLIQIDNELNQLLDFIGAHRLNLQLEKKNQSLSVIPLFTTSTRKFKNRNILNAI